MLKNICQFALAAAIAGLWVLYFNPSLYEGEKAVALTRLANETGTPTEYMRELENWLPQSGRENTSMLSNMGSAVSFSNDWKIPEWVAAKLTATISFSPDELGHPVFRRDPRAESSAAPKYFSGKKYLAVRAITDGIGAMYGPKALRQAKSTSAAFPLTPKAAKAYEKTVNAIYGELLPKYKTVYYFAGPIPRQPTEEAEMLNGAIYVPAGIFVMAAYRNESGALETKGVAIWQDGKKAKVGVSEIENLTGLAFFPKHKEQFPHTKGEEQ